MMKQSGADVVTSELSMFNSSVLLDVSCDVEGFIWIICTYLHSKFCQANRSCSVRIPFKSMKWLTKVCLSFIASIQTNAVWSHLHKVRCGCLSRKHLNHPSVILALFSQNTLTTSCCFYKCFDLFPNPTIYPILDTISKITRSPSSSWPV